MRINLNVKVVFLIVGVILITTITLGTISFATAKKALIKSVQKGLNTESEKIALQIEEFNEKEFNLLRCLANMPLVKDESVPLDEKCRQLKLMVDGDPGKYENISYYNKEGNSYNRDGIYHSSAHKDYFQAAIQGKEFVCDPFYSDVGKKVLQIFSVPVYTGNEITGVVTAILYGDHLTEIVKQIDVGGGFHPAIINRNTSQTIANANEGVDDGSSGNEMDQESEIAKVLNSVMAGDSDTRQFRDPSIGIDMIASYRPIGKTAPWSVFCVVPAIVFYMDLIKIRIAIIVTIVVAVIFANILGFLLIKIFLKPLMTVKSAINDIGSGNADLTKRLDKTSSDEIGEIVDGFNNFAGNLQTIMKSIKDANQSLESVGSNLNSKTTDTENAIAEIISNIDTMHANIDEQVNSVTETSGAVNEIASNIESLERMIGNQSSSVSQASTAVEQMIGNISSVNNSMDKMANSFEQLSLSAKSGSSLQAVANERIETIKGQSETLLEANLAIAEIAEQTNLLAMNAAIEAAHAGEAGKGFSVVADEIRKLSETSSEQSKTIGVQLTNIRESIEQMVGAAQKSTEAFHDVTTKISETDEVVRQIKAAMEEQEIGSKQITNALHSMNDSTLEVRTASREMAEGNKAILEEIKNLQNTTSSMRQSMGEMSNGAKKINETGIELDVLSETLKENISNIGEQINQFIV